MYGIAEEIIDGFALLNAGIEAEIKAKIRLMTSGPVSKEELDAAEAQLNQLLDAGEFTEFTEFTD